MMRFSLANAGDIFNSLYTGRQILASHIIPLYYTVILGDLYIITLVKIII